MDFEFKILITFEFFLPTYIYKYFSLETMIGRTCDDYTHEFVKAFIKNCIRSASYHT